MGTNRRSPHKGRKPFYKEFRLNTVDEKTGDDELEEDNGFLCGASVKSLSLDGCFSLTEEDALVVFETLRWPEGPECVLCGGKKLHAFPSRRTRRCADCYTEFSCTTRTVFSNHKMTFKKILMSIAVTLGASQVKTASEAARQVGITTKAALTFYQRLRSAAGVAPLEVESPFKIGQTRYFNGLHLSTRSWWTPDEKSALRQFVTGGFSPNEVADTLGRSPSSIANYARDSGILLPTDWKMLISQRKIAVVSGPMLAYPYVVRRRPENSDVLTVNDLIPKSFPDQMRADICQEVMLAVLEGSVTIKEIRENRQKAAWFFKKFWVDNHEAAGHAVSLGGTSDDERSYDEVASSLAAKDWHHEQVIDRTRYGDAIQTFYPPTQIDDVYESQLRRSHRALWQSGEFLDRHDVRDRVDDGYKPNHIPHSQMRAEQRYGLRLDRSAAAKIRGKIDSGDCTIVSEQNDDVIRVMVEYGGRNLPVVYSRINRTIITIYLRPFGT